MKQCNTFLHTEEMIEFQFVGNALAIESSDEQRTRLQNNWNGEEIEWKSENIERCVYHPTRPWTNRINRFDFKHQCFGRVIKVVVAPIHCIAHVRCGDVHFAKYSRQCGASTREILHLCRRAKNKCLSVVKTISNIKKPR